MKKLVGEIAAILDKERNVKFAYLFGSYATGEWTSRSDVDIAVYLEKPSLDARLEVHHTLSRRLQKEVDLVVLNEVRNIYLLESIITQGVVVKDSEERPWYEVRKEHEIIDFKLFRRRIDAA